MPLYGSPEMEEMKPLNIQATADLKGTFVVPLRHDTTLFEWIPSKDSTGNIFVGATAVPCSGSAENFDPPSKQPH
jgi:hypothetical protein